jgi:hypothetical protein
MSPRSTRRREFFHLEASRAASVVRRSSTAIAVAMIGESQKDTSPIGACRYWIFDVQRSIDKAREWGAFGETTRFYGVSRARLC